MGKGLGLGVGGCDGSGEVGLGSDVEGVVVTSIHPHAARPTRTINSRGRTDAQAAVVGHGEPPLLPPARLAHVDTTEPLEWGQTDRARLESSE